MQVIFYIKGRHRERTRNTMKGKSLMMEFDEGQVEDVFYNGDSERGNNINSATGSLSVTSSFVQIGSLPKPVVLPPLPSPGLNPSTARLLFRKDLKLSDVGHARRIIIPKGPAEKYLPSLTDGDGIFIYMDDMNGARVWVFRYRYWQNNNSRMFVLEKTGDFVKEHGLQAGDIVLIYKDEHTGRYGIQAKKGEIKQIIANDEANVPMSCYGNAFHRDEIGAYACPVYNNNMQNFMMNFLGGPDLTVPNVEQSMSFDPTNVYPHYYF